MIKGIRRLSIRQFSKNAFNDVEISIPPTNFDWDYIFSEKNIERIRANIADRKSPCDFHSILEMIKKNKPDVLKENPQFIRLLKKLPNSTHPKSPIGDETFAQEVAIGGTKPEFKFPPRSASVISAFLAQLRTTNTGVITGPRSYYLMDQLAELEEAICEYALDVVQKKGFQLVTVPEILNDGVIECCGVVNDSDRSLVYRLEPEYYGKHGLSGTSELALAGLNLNKTFSEAELPSKLTACSRCYRAEVSTVEDEKGIYRVHQFAKTEMFGITTKDKSDAFLEELLNIQREIFDSFGLHYRVLNMPSEELGASAYCKYDIEAWIPSSNSYGEISSCSNCTDYQSRRLHIRYKDSEGNVHFAHTLNGTAVALPRLLIPLIETYQTSRYCVDIPDVLHPYMPSGTKQLTEQSKIIMHFNKSLPKVDDNF